MKRILLRLLPLLCLSGPVALADDAALRVIEQRLQKMPQMLGRFEQKKTLPQLPRPLLSSGVLALSEESGVSWRVLAPIESHLVLSQAQSAQDPLAGQIALPLMQILRGDFHALQELFAIEARTDEAQWQLALTPRGGTMADFIGSIEVTGAGTIEQIRLTEVNRALTEITLLDLRSVAADAPQLIAEFEQAQ